MENQSPKYLFIAHLYVEHPLILQKVFSIAKVFRDYNPNCTTTATPISNGFFSLIVSADEAVCRIPAHCFERNVTFTEGVKLLFSQDTIDVDCVGYPYPPTFIYTAFFALEFNYLSYHFGEGYQFRKELKRILEGINGGGYYYHAFQSEMALVIESTHKHDPQDIERLMTHLNNRKVKSLTSFQNF